MATAGKFTQWYFGAYSMYPPIVDPMGQVALPGVALVGCEQRCHCLWGHSTSQFADCCSHPLPFRLSRIGSAIVLKARAQQGTDLSGAGREWEVSAPPGILSVPSFISHPVGWLFQVL